MSTNTDDTTTQAGTAIAPVLLTSEQAWTLCALSKAAWYKAKSAGRIPRPVKIGGALRWRRDELLRWIEAGCPIRQAWESRSERK